jgi:CRISPR-associated endoribonuclease Cas6
MHITLWFSQVWPGNGDSFIRVPRSNLHLFQSLLYNVLPPDRAAFLHEEGYRVRGRSMKLFAMSWPIAASAPTFEDKTIRFPLPVRLVVSTPVIDTMDGIASGALSSKELRIGNNVVFCDHIEAEQQRVDGDTLIIKTLSPITCYDQSERDGKPYTVYFEPEDRDFTVSVHNNLVRKFRALYPEREVPGGPVIIMPLGDIRPQAARFNANSSFFIKGWSGRFFLRGPEELLQVALDCGIGAKNSAGWGCVTKEG